MLPNPITSPIRHALCRAELLKANQERASHLGTVVLEDDDGLRADVLVHELGVVHEEDGIGELFGEVETAVERAGGVTFDQEGAQALGTFQRWWDREEKFEGVDFLPG